MPKNKKGRSRKKVSKIQPYDHNEGRRSKVTDLNGTLDRMQNEVRESTVIQDVPKELDVKEKVIPKVFAWKPEQQEKNALIDCFKR